MHPRRIGHMEDKLWKRISGRGKPGEKPAVPRGMPATNHHTMINQSLLKCALGKHEFGKMLHDDTLDRWIKICIHCNTTIEVEAPKNEDGEPIDPHEWLQHENEISEAELHAMLTKFVE